MELKQLLTISTKRLTSVEVYESDTSFNGEDLYLIVSTDTDGCVSTRFGNLTQITSILKTYRYSVSPESREAYEKFMGW